MIKPAASIHPPYTMSCFCYLTPIQLQVSISVIGYTLGRFPLIGSPTCRSRLQLFERRLQRRSSSKGTPEKELPDLIVFHAYPRSAIDVPSASLKLHYQPALHRLVDMSNWMMAPARTFSASGRARSALTRFQTQFTWRLRKVRKEKMQGNPLLIGLLATQEFLSINCRE